MSVPDGTAEKGRGFHPCATTCTSLPACPPGRHSFHDRDPVVPGLITGLHHRLPSNPPSGSNALLPSRTAAAVLIKMFQPGCEAKEKLFSGPRCG
jgi:hypothetical protein